MAEITKPSVSFAALKITNEQRNAYGMRYNDYARYRKHCANRTHRLRSSLKMTHGKGRDFKKLPPLTQDNISDGHLQLLLIEAERAWAYSQELNSEALQPANREKSSTLRHSATGRFRRAVHWSTQLLSHCQTLHASSRLSTENLLEATVYTLIINGRFLRYRDSFEDALMQLSVARGLLDVLASSASTSRDQALATLFSDEIGPEIRYCAHELGRAKAYDIDGIVSDLFSKHKNEIVLNCDVLVEKLSKESSGSGKGEARKKLRPLIWEGQPVPVRNPELVDVFLKVQEAENKLGVDHEDSRKSGLRVGSKKGVAAYDAVLLALSDAEDLARKLVESQQLAGGPSTGTRDIHFLHSYILYQLLSRRIQRDLLLVSALLVAQPAQNLSSVKKARAGPKEGQQVDGRLYPAVVKLFDTVLQSLDQMRSLTLVDDSPDLASAIEARVSFTKAKRCLYLSRCYAPLKKFGEALTLIQHANIHARETNSSLSLFTSPQDLNKVLAFYSLQSSDVGHLEKELAADGLQLKRDWFAYNGGSLDADGAAYKKPLFFNIALNYVELDMDRLRARAGKQPEVAKPAPVVSQTKTETLVLDKKPITKAKVEEIRPATPEPQTPARGGLSSLLGGWWGK